MTDFAGNVQLGPLAGPFPDPDVGTPKPTGFDNPAYPPSPLDHSDPAVVPSLYDPFERVRTFLSTFGVDPFNPDAVAEVEDGSFVAGPSALQEASLGPFQNVAGFVDLDQPSEWFEKWHVFPGRLDLGNVLTTQIRTLELFNSFRTETRTWEAFVNNAGAGVAATNLPSLPRLMVSLESFVVDVQVTTAGPPSIFGTLDFDIDTAIDLLIVPITGTRITLFQYRPQSPISETLQFKTDIIEVNDGSEQRINVRENPRQLFKFTVRTDDDRTRDSINAVLFDWQSRVFGIPVWHESKALDQPLAIGNTIVFVNTAFADFRVGGLAMIYDNDFRTETLEIVAVDPTFLELQVPVSKAFDAVQTIVIPVRTALTRPQLSDARFAIGPTDFSLEFTTLDNVDLASSAAFPTYLGGGQTVAKPLIDRLNFMKGRTVKEGIRRKVVRLDPETGPALQFSSWTKGKPSFLYGFEGKSFEDTWDFRQLLHFLRGSQLAFYVGTGRDDFKAIADIADTSTQIDFQAFGFTQFVQEVTPRSDLQVVRLDGTTSQHLITGSSVVSDTVERITISPGITPALPLVDIDRIEFLTLSRISNDAPKFSHTRPGESRIDFTLTGVPS